MCRSRIFDRGGEGGRVAIQVQLAETSVLNKVFSFFFSSPRLILLYMEGVPMGIYKTIIFQGSNGGSLLLIPIEIYRTCDYPGGLSHPSPPLSGSMHAVPFLSPVGHCKGFRQT